MPSCAVAPAARLPVALAVSAVLSGIGCTGASRAIGFGIGPQAPPPVHAPPARRVEVDRLLQDMQALSAPGMEGRLTGSAGSRRAQALILERFRRLGLRPPGTSYEQTFPVRLSGGPPDRDDSDATNLLGLIPGTVEPQRFVLVSAHYDHLGVRGGRTYHGADDNASGVAALLEIASWFARHPPRDSILFAAFDAEEHGLRGAKHFVANPPIDLRRVTAVVNLDMIGRGDDNTVIVAGTFHNPWLEPVVVEAARGRDLKVVFGHDRPAGDASGTADWTQSSDHGPFHDAGVPFLYFGVKDHADYHRPTDIAGRIPARFFVEVTEVVLETVRSLAGGAPVPHP